MEIQSIITFASAPNGKMPLGMRDCGQPYRTAVGSSVRLVFVKLVYRSAVGRLTSIAMSVAYLRHAC